MIQEFGGKDTGKIEGVNVRAETKETGLSRAGVSSMQGVPQGGEQSGAQPNAVASKSEEDGKRDGPSDQMTQLEVAEKKRPSQFLSGQAISSIQGETK